MRESLKDESPDLHRKYGVILFSGKRHSDMATQISDRGRELIKYVLDWHENLQMPWERHIRNVLIKRSKNDFRIESAKKLALSRPWPQTFTDFEMGIGDPRVEAEVALGWSEIAYRIVFRMLTAHPQLEIKRCPRCQGALRTPLAQQCINCHHKWHVQNRE